MVGWLEKQGGAHGGNKAWKRRWFMLSGSLLSYFNSPSESATLGIFDLKGAVLVDLGNDKTKIVLSWKSGKGSPDEPNRELRALTPEDAEKWKTAIRKGIRVNTASRDFAPPVAKSLPPDVEQLCFSFVMTSQDNNRFPLAFVCRSLMSIERFYFSILAAMISRQKLSLKQQEELHRSSLKSNPNDVNALLALAMVLEQSGNISDAINFANSARAKSPNSPLAAKLCGFLYMKSGNETSALPHLKSAAVHYRYHDAMTLRLLGEAYSATNQPLFAVASLEAAHSVDPLDLAVRLDLGELLAYVKSLDRCAEAVAHIRAVIKSGRKDASTRLLLATSLEGTGEFSEALKEFEGVLSTMNIVWELRQKALEGKARACSALGMYSDSMQSLVACVKGSSSAVPLLITDLADIYSKAAFDKRPSFGLVALSTKPNDDEDDDEDEKDPAVVPIGLPPPSSLPPPPSTIPPPLPAGLPPPPPGMLPPPPQLTPSVSYPAAVDAIFSTSASAFKALETDALYNASETLVSYVLASDSSNAQALLIRATARELLGGAAELKSIGSGSTLLEGSASDYAAISPDSSVAFIGLGRLAKRASKWEDAISNFEKAIKLATEEEDTEAQENAKDLLSRSKRLQLGEPEFVKEVKKRKEDDIKYEESGVDLPLEEMANMTAEERQAVYFKTLKAEKKRKEDEAKAAEDSKIAKMSDEERAEYEASKALEAKHEAKKEKAISKSLGQYSGGAKAALLKGRGRGRA
jgi:cytochrome c-type biogenesis protein CcmH/NrfG